MNLKWAKHVLMKPDGDGTGGGGGGTPAPAPDNLLTGGGTPAPNEPPPPAPPATPTPQETWKASLPDELKNEAALKVIHDIPTLAKSYINAQKMVGVDKIAIPSKHSTEDDWKQVFSKLGNPEKLEDYKIEKPQNASFGDEFVTAFKEQAHKFGVLPQQSQKLMDWFAESSNAKAAQINASQTQLQEAQLNNLKADWGKAFDQNVKLAQTAVQKFADPDAVKFLNDSGLANNAHLIRILAKAGQQFKEDGIHGKGGGESAMTPADAQVKINSILGNPSHPYFDKAHASHKDAVIEVQKLFSFVKPS